MRAVVALRSAVVAPAIASLGPAATVTAVAVITRAAIGTTSLAAILSTLVLSTLGPPLAAFSRRGRAIGGCLRGRGRGCPIACPIARTWATVAAAIAVSTATAAVATALARGSSVGGRRFATGLVCGRLATLPLIGSLVGAAAALVSLPAAIGAAFGRTVVAMAPPRPPDLDEWHL